MQLLAERMETSNKILRILNNSSEDLGANMLLSWIFCSLTQLAY